MKQKMMTTCLALAALMVCPLASADEDPIKVFILAGQSNMVGYGTVEGDSAGPGTLRNMVNSNLSTFGHGGTNPLVDSNGDWIIRDDVNVYAHNNNDAFRNASNAPILKISGHTAGLGAWSSTNRSLLGPEYGFGQVVGNALDEDVLIIKVANGGTTLGEDWRSPTAVANRGGTTGAMWTVMLDEVDSVLTNLDTHFAEYAGRTTEIAGFGWFQGWNDIFNGTFTSDYEVNMTDLITDVRAVYGDDLPFVLGTTGPNGWDASGNQLDIINAQLAMDEIDGVAVVETRGMYRDGTESPSNFGFHWNHNGEAYFDIGTGLGDAYLTLVPEPGTLGLFAMGVLLTLRRRHE